MKKNTFLNTFQNTKCESTTGCLTINIMSTDYVLENGFQNGLQNSLCNFTGYPPKKEGFGLSVGNYSLIQLFSFWVYILILQYYIIIYS